MSYRAPAQNSKESSSDDRIAARQHASAASSPSTYSARAPPLTAPVTSSPTVESRSHTVGHSFELPPLSQSRSGPGSALPFSTTRIGDVSSILNPTRQDESQPNRGRRHSQFESPASPPRHLPPILAGARSPRSRDPPFPTASPSTGHAVPIERSSRRMLTPKSPSLRYAASSSQLNASTRSIGVRRNPSLDSSHRRAYAVESGLSGAPSLPTSTSASRAGHGFSAVNALPAAAQQIVQEGSGSLSQSESPTSSYSSRSQTDQTSPAAHYSNASMGALSASHHLPEGDTGNVQDAFGHDQRATGIPISSSGGQNVYQMFTLETSAGTVQLPVDVQAASRVADEKRKRNAGASARFRQRRKEKEREASTTISRLEEQVKELREDADFYKHERDRVKEELLQVSGGQHQFQSKTSPRHNRSNATNRHSGVGDSSYHSARERATRSPTQGRNVRRRTSTFSLPPPQQGTLSAQGAVMPSSYVPLAPQPPLAPPPIQTPTSLLPSPGTRAQLPSLSQMPYAPPSQTQQRPQLQHHHQQNNAPGPAQGQQYGSNQSQQATYQGLPQILQSPINPGPYNPFAVERRPPPGPRGPSSGPGDR